MDELIKKEILYDLSSTIKILEQPETKDIEELKQLSDHAITHVALYKNLDVISVTVLIYSLYKTISCIPEKEYAFILSQLRLAHTSLSSYNLATYNRSIQAIFKAIKKCDSQVKMHLQDVMHAARIKKSADLLQKGLSVGQAAGLMGLSNWDLQQYVGKTIVSEHQESVPIQKRLSLAFKLFQL